MLPAVTVATPFVNVIVSGVPKLTAVPFLSVTVGLNEPIELAPEKVSVLSPVYATLVLPAPSLAVIVRFWLVPAVWVAEPVMTSLVAAPEATLSLPVLTVGKCAALFVHPSSRSRTSRRAAELRRRRALRPSTSFRSASRSSRPAYR